MIPKTEDMERELQGAIDTALQAPKVSGPTATWPRADAQPVNIAAARPQTLVEQVNQMERIERQIADRLRRELIAANAEADRQVAEAHSHYERQVSEETARLQRERDEMIRQAIEGYYVKRNELEALLRRRP